MKRQEPLPGLSRFFRRIIVPGKRFSLPSELTLASVYMRIRLTPALQVPTVLVNALIA